MFTPIIAPDGVKLSSSLSKRCNRSQNARSSSGRGCVHDGSLLVAVVREVGMEDHQIMEKEQVEVAPSNRKYITVLQNNILPFKNLLDQIYGEHDVEQDDHYSPYMLGVHFQHTEIDETTNDDIHLGGTDEYGRTSYPSVNLNLSASDEEEPRISRSPLHSGREVSHHSPYTTRRSSSGVRNTLSTRRAHIRRSNFEAQIDGIFQRMKESRGQLLDVMRSSQYKTNIW
ncbi:unnamed protein product [Eruca vesicaria subsp. sativa]|uniref:Uncharacterized protein n=1 Tax=Eruca vesicaria subsp. sativa TaxID=29727 RepID=A0ABC8JSL0_ERUVS|nr:unnamed protein product [Eruca vesicaria subsp. sativa]